MTAPNSASAAACPSCGHALPVPLRACPRCGALIHAAELTRLAGLAEEAERQGELSAALRHWKDALELLPGDAPQRPVIAGRVRALHDRLVAGERASAADAKPKPPGVRESWKNGGVLAALGAMFLKFKTLLFLILAKAKLILLGLAKLKTLLSMLAYFGTYWAMYGWKYAAGIVISIYVHEMGHVVAARRYGIKASAPVFIPFVGAFILLKERVNDMRVNARIGLEGPVFGLGAALAFYVAYLATSIQILGVIAATGAWINMFNLLPLFFLDGARGYSSLTRNDRWTLVASLAGVAFLMKDPLLGILALIGAGVSAFGTPSEESDKPMLFLYLFLAVSLSLIVHASGVSLGH